MTSYLGTPNPSAPPAPDSQSQSQSDHPRVGVAYPYHPNQPPSNHSLPYAPISSTSTSFGSGSNPQAQGYGYGYYPNYQPQQHQQQAFPAGTHPDVIRSFQMVDRNRNGYIEEEELREALTWNYQKFSLATLRLLIFLFRNPRETSPRIGAKEFAEIWSCLGQWRAIFERFDRDRSGKIDAAELRDALYSLGYALPPSVLRVLVSRYDDGSGRRADLSFDSFVECGMIVKGLTEKFKEKDPRYTGSATLSYDAFLSMVIPFVVSD